MPWRPEPTKDVAQLRKASGSRLAGSDPKISEIGKPTRSHILEPRNAEGTQRTETSQYLQEEKENSTPQVAASERGSAQTTEVSRLRPLLQWCCGIYRAYRNGSGSYKTQV